MNWRTGNLWALAGCIALAFLLVFACHPGFAVGTPSGMSAPSVPAAVIESTPAAQLLQSQFDWCGHALRPASLSLALLTVGAGDGARQDPDTSDPPHYGPLHRRPPPSFS